MRERERERERVTNYSNIRELTAPNTQITNRLITKEISKATPKERYISNMFQRNNHSYSIYINIIKEIIK